jgi:hypothetical protein
MLFDVLDEEADTDAEFDTDLLDKLEESL